MTAEMFRCVAGSRLFGTANANSDTDYKAVHVPDARSILLQTANAVITQNTGSATAANTSDDTDFTSFPVAKYLNQLATMETIAVEMLFAPNMHEDWLWDQIVEDRMKLLSRNKKPFTGYAKGQAMRYAVRGERLETLERVVAILESLDPKVAMKDQWVLFPDLPGIRVYQKPEFGSETPYMSVFGREVPLTARPAEALKVYRKPIEEAGKRTVQAAETGGTDWKGLYHALRVVEEGIELFSTGSLIFPCHNAAFYRSIRNGDLNLDYVLGVFEDRLADLEELDPISDFRDAPDKEWIEEYVASVHESTVVGAYYAWMEEENA